MPILKKAAFILNKYWREHIFRLTISQKEMC